MKKRALECIARSTAKRGFGKGLLGLMLGGFGALLGVMAHGFRWL